MIIFLILVLGISIIFFLIFFIKLPNYYDPINKQLTYIQQDMDDAIKKMNNAILETCPDGHKHIYKEKEKTPKTITFKCINCGNEFSIPNFDTIMDDVHNLLNKL